MNSRFPSSDCAIFIPLFPARSSSTGFSLCSLSLGQSTEHRLKPVLLQAASRALSDRSLFDRLLVADSLKYGVHKDSRCVHGIGWQRSQFNQLLHFRDHIIRRCRHHGIEIPRGLAIDKVAPAVALPRLDEREVPPQTALKNIFAPVELPGFFPF